MTEAISIIGQCRLPGGKVIPPGTFGGPDTEHYETARIEGIARWASLVEVPCSRGNGGTAIDIDEPLRNALGF